MNNVLKYPGSKSRIAKWIVSFIPEHDVYLEPFFGGGAIFFNKKPSRIETINDLSAEVYNYFKVLRDNPEELIHLLSITPYGREEYNTSFDESIDNIERARTFAVRCCQGFGCSNKYKNGFRSSIGAKSPRTTTFWNNFPETLEKASKRLLQAQIENQDALKLIERYNKEEVFIYADPPYPLNTRKNYLYEFEMTNNEHIKLLELLKKHKGKVMISSYENELYDEMLKGWEKVFKNTTAENSLKRVEVLYMNYKIIKNLDFIGGSPGGQVSNNFALVELEDWAVTLVKPQDITFLDNEFVNYYFGGENDK